MEYVIGFDGGGTKTAAVILDSQGRIAGYGEGGPSTYGVVPIEVTRGSITTAAEMARRAGRLPEARFGAAFLGLGNVVSELDRNAVRSLAADLGIASPESIGVDHDCRIALAGGLSGRPGIVLIAGTGASCFGINEAGRTWRAGGWGPLIDDEGSSYWLGIQAMRAAALDYDGRGRPSLLARQIRDRLELQDMNELMNHLYAAGMSRTEIAALAPLVYEAAAQEDPVAVDLLRAGSEAMADCVLAVARKLEMEAAQVELTAVGGLTQAGQAFFKPLGEAVHRRLPGCRVLPAELPPALGAGILALSILHHPLDPIVLEQIRLESQTMDSLANTISH